MAKITAIAYLPSRPRAGAPVQFNLATDPVPLPGGTAVYIDWGDGSPVVGRALVDPPAHTYAEGRRTYTVMAWAEGQAEPVSIDCVVY